MNEKKEAIRAGQRELAKEFASRGDVTGWFEELYKRAEGDNEKIAWADLEPNRFLQAWAERTGLKGDGRKALVVGCGLGDDAVYLDDLGFDVTAFDISSTAIEWAKRLHADRKIKFEAMDLLEPFRGWLGAFDFVLEVYTIQPLPLDIRVKVIDSIAAFPKAGGELVVVTRGREDDEKPDQLPWPLSRKDLQRFEENGLVQRHFEIRDGDEADPMQRFVVVYERPS